jgi:hypothetical protein
MSVINRIPLFLPELVILATVNMILKIIRKDYNDKVQQGKENENLLYLLLQGQSVGRSDLYKEAVQIFITTSENPKHFDCKLNYDQNAAEAPQLYVTQPAENTVNNSLGIGVGDQDELILVSTEDPDQFREQYARRYTTSQYVMIVCENRTEMYIIYNVIKAMLVACFNHLELSGLSNLKLNGQELKMRGEIPDKLFQKAVIMNFEYQQVTPAIVVNDVIRKIQIYWRPIEAETSQGPIVVSVDDDLEDSSSSS